MCTLQSMVLGKPNAIQVIYTVHNSSGGIVQRPPATSEVKKQQIFSGAVCKSSV
jgi:hypothetical protein